MRIYKISFLDDIENAPRSEVVLWEDDVGDFGSENSLRNIHFIQDKSGVDKFTFVVNIDHPMYHNFNARANKIVRLYKSYKYDKYFDFIIMFVDIDRISKQKSITCAAPLVVLDWTPVALKNTTNGSGVYPPNPTGGRVNQLMTLIISHIKNTWQENCLFGIGSFPDANNHTGAFNYVIPNNLKFNAMYSAVKDDLLSTSGCVLHRIGSHYTLYGIHFNDDYACMSIEWLQGNADIIEVTNSEAITSWRETEDLEAYLTHSVVYKQDDTGKVVRSKTDAVREVYEQIAFGQRYLLNCAGDDAFSDAREQAKSAVRCTRISTSDISVNPAAIADYHDIEVFKRLHFDIDSLELGIQLDSMYLITKCDLCIDDPLKSKIEIEFIS